MCCLFGVVDHSISLTRGSARLVSSLSIGAQTCSTDATGLAYCSHGHLQIRKALRPAQAVRFRILVDAAVIMDHSRKPSRALPAVIITIILWGKASEMPFVLAHNGALCNDDVLHRPLELPGTRIETDSYAAVQLKTRGAHILRPAGYGRAGGWFLRFHHIGSGKPAVRGKRGTPPLPVVFSTKRLLRLSSPRRDLSNTDFSCSMAW